MAELIIGKQRNGPTGVVKLAFIREFTRFENLAPANPADDSPHSFARVDLDAVAHQFPSASLEHLRPSSGPRHRRRRHRGGQGECVRPWRAVRWRRALEEAGADLLACADIEEGAELRGAGVRAEILIFGALERERPRRAVRLLADADDLYAGRRAGRAGRGGAGTGSRSATT